MFAFKLLCIFSKDLSIVKVSGQPSSENLLLFIFVKLKIKSIVIIALMCAAVTH